MFTGVIVNVVAILAGSAAGLFLKNRLRQRYHTALIDVLSLGVMGVGVSYTIKAQNILVNVWTALAQGCKSD